jgi:2-keto-3-deoxy-6-phosphogluconate aldolase
MTYEHTNIKSIPTGGVNPKNLCNYLELPNVLAYGDWELR